MSTPVPDLTAVLRDMPVAAWRVWLTTHSGLPGPRGNLELADAFAAVADRDTIMEYASLSDEYLRFCGTEALGSVLLDEPTSPEVLALLHERASDDLWRVREGAARAIQLVGDESPALMRSVIVEWARDPDPYASEPR